LTVKIGKNFSQFSIKNDDTSEQNLKFLKNFNLLSQIELQESRIDIQGFFGIKSAGSSNYRGATFFASGKKKPKSKLVLSGVEGPMTV
jgi:hypothetical protein